MDLGLNPTLPSDILLPPADLTIGANVEFREPLCCNFSVPNSH